MEAPVEHPEAPGRRAQREQPGPRGRPSRRFVWALVLIAFAALTLRVVYVVTVTHDDPHIYDATYYEMQARTMTHGQGFFEDPFLIFEPKPVHLPAADHPPLTVMVLLPAALVEGPDASELAMRFTMVLIGTAGVVLVGLLTRSLAGDVAGLVAAVIAALDPNLWINDGLIMSEALSALLTIAIVWCVYRVIRHGTTWRNALGLGLLVALGLLARAEFVLYVPFLAIPALWIGSRRASLSETGGDLRGTARRMIGMSALALGVVVLVVGPWVGYNLSRFDRFTTISTNDGLALRAANCPATYSGPLLGFAVVGPPCTRVRGATESSVWNAAVRSDGLDYLTGHLRRLPIVALARLGRAWNVYRIRQTADLSTLEGRPTWATYLATAVTWVLVPLAVAGLVLLRRRRVPVWPLVVPIVATSAVIALVAGGLLRYRDPTEPMVIVLAAVAIARLVARYAGRSRRDPEPEPGFEPSPDPGDAALVG